MEPSEISVLNCPCCDGPRTYMLRHGAWACLDCDIWLQKACGWADCRKCVNRPAAPSATHRSLAVRAARHKTANLRRYDAQVPALLTSPSMLVKADDPSYALR